MTTINLMPPRYAFAHAIRTRRTFWGAACTITSTLSALTIAVSIAHTPATADGQARLVRLQTERPTNGQRAIAPKHELESRTIDVPLPDQVSGPPDWPAPRSDLARWPAVQAQLELVGIRLGSSDASFVGHVTGTSQTQEFVAEFVSALRDSGWFKKVTLTGTQRVNQDKSPRYRFDINCEFIGFETQAEALR